jgi:hypothetical protein
MSTEVSPQVREFLKANIPGHEHLEVLLCMCRDPKPFTAQDISARLELPIEVTKDAMTHLWRIKLLETRSMGDRQFGFAYVPPTPQIDASVHALVAEYSANRFGVVQLIATLAIDRIRNATIHHFADAFLIKPKADKDG